MNKKGKFQKFYQNSWVPMPAQNVSQFNYRYIFYVSEGKKQLSAAAIGKVPNFKEDVI